VLHDVTPESVDVEVDQRDVDQRDVDGLVADALGVAVDDYRGLKFIDRHKDDRDPAVAAVAADAIRARRAGYLPPTKQGKKNA
jgi:hypothetical protein